MKIVTINQFLRNPAGKGSAAGARRDLIIADLNKRFDTLMKEAKKDFKMEVFQENNNYFFVFKIPSEHFTNSKLIKDKLLYDVVIQLLPIGDAHNDLTLNRYAVKVFSNAPNFTFTYAYVYNKDGIIIDFLKNKLPNLALTKPPEIRNPHQEYGFEKSVYFALLYITTGKYSTKSLLRKSKDLNILKLTQTIITSDAKLSEYNRLKAKEELAKNKNAKKEEKDRIKKGLPPKNFKSVKRKRHKYYRSGKIF